MCSNRRFALKKAVPKTTQRYSLSLIHISRDELNISDHATEGIQYTVQSDISIAATYKAKEQKDVYKRQGRYLARGVRREILSTVHSGVVSPGMSRYSPKVCDVSGKMIAIGKRMNSGG